MKTNMRKARRDLERGSCRALRVVKTDIRKRLYGMASSHLVRLWPVSCGLV